MEEKAQIEMLWKILDRHDKYIISTHNKATMLLAFNTFIMGGLIIKSGDILCLFNGTRFLQIVVSILLALSAFASIYSLYKLFAVINPYLYSLNKPSEYQSNIFFIHIANLNKESDYYSEIKKEDYLSLIKDLTFQIYALSKGTKDKYRDLKKAIQSILYVIIPSLFIIIVLKLLNEL